MEQVWMIWDTMLRHGIEPDERHYEYLVVRLTNGGNLEMALQYLNEQGQKGKPVSLRAIRSVIRMACRLCQPSIALELARAYESTSVRRLDPADWLDILSASSEAFYVSVYDGIGVNY